MRTFNLQAMIKSGYAVEHNEYRIFSVKETSQLSYVVEKYSREQHTYLLMDTFDTINQAMQVTFQTAEKK